LVSSGVHTKLYNQWLKAKGLESAKQIINEYNQSWWEAIKEPQMNKLIIKWMKEWLLEINESEKKYELENMLNDNNIDLENKTIKWFTNNWWTPIEFGSYKELFDTANLTNWIKKNFNWRPANSERPFHIDVVEWRIEFDDTERYKVWKNETDVLKFRTLLKNSTLRKNREFYINFLNKRRETEGMNRFDLTSYPSVKWLSELWIQFTDEAEIKKTEQLLTRIKNLMGHFAIGTEWYKPYSIKWNKLIFATSNTDSKKELCIPDDLENKSPWETLTLSDYPTILRNQQKFLEYMNNNKANHMRWQKIQSTV
jgi:hypothetical protein